MSRLSSLAHKLLNACAYAYAYAYACVARDDWAKYERGRLLGNNDNDK